MEYSEINIKFGDNREIYVKGYVIEISCCWNRICKIGYGCMSFRSGHSVICVDIDENKAEEILREVYEKYDQPIVVTNRRSAEMIKYA